MARSSKDEMNQTRRLMGALVRMKPKPHAEMKVHKSARKSRKRKTKQSATKGPPSRP